MEREATERLHFHLSLSCIGEGNGNPLQCEMPAPGAWVSRERRPELPEAPRLAGGVHSWLSAQIQTLRAHPL